MSDRAGQAAVGGTHRRPYASRLPGRLADGGLGWLLIRILAEQISVLPAADGTEIHVFTHQAYEAAFGSVDERYWIPAAEAERRRQVLDMYATIGITDRGMTSAIGYAAA
ncbi:hypothetical protein ACL07V_36530 [Streptomyces sp. MB22_4]|uniref:hypothetical protein n=1 Tax=Streptomyces sp. MB22_4 TaxID=3383120 RepID=UPI00399EEAD2